MGTGPQRVGVHCGTRRAYNPSNRGTATQLWPLIAAWECQSGPTRLYDFLGDARKSNFQVDFLFKKKKKKLGIYFQFKKKVKVTQDICSWIWPVGYWLMIFPLNPCSPM